MGESATHGHAGLGALHAILRPFRESRWLDRDYDEGSLPTPGHHRPYRLARCLFPARTALALESSYPAQCNVVGGLDPLETERKSRAEKAPAAPARWRSRRQDEPR